MPKLLQIYSRRGLGPRRVVATAWFDRDAVEVVGERNVAEVVRELLSADFDESVGFPPESIAAPQGTDAALEAVAHYFRRSVGLESRVVEQTATVVKPEVLEPQTQPVIYEFDSGMGVASETPVAPSGGFVFALEAVGG